MTKLRVLDLFSGIGGFSLGLERTGGFETVAFCEIEEFPRRVLAKHWPGVPQYHDVTKLTGDILERDGIAVDVITGGFPCQDLSVAGRGAGVDGERSGLWAEIVRLVRELQPKFVIMENSPSLCTRGGSAIIAALAHERYDAEWEGFPGLSFGAKHIRARQYVVAYPSEKRHGAPTHKVFARGNSPVDGGWWSREPRLGRVADGVSSRVDRVAALGNAVIPQIPEFIGNAILASEAAA